MRAGVSMGGVPPSSTCTNRRPLSADPFMSLQLGILLALLCAFASNLAFLYKHRGACSACDVDIRHPFRTARSLWSQRWFAIGMLVGLAAWILHVGAMSLAPL